MASHSRRSHLDAVSGWRMRAFVVSCLAGAAVLAVFAALPAHGDAGPLQKHPDVVAVEARAGRGQTFDFDVTVASPYDTPQRYADAFRVSGSDGRVYGERRLLHDHANEQPFTRDLYDVAIPREVETVVVQARDSRYGYGGATVEVRLPGR